MFKKISLIALALLLAVTAIVYPLRQKKNSNWMHEQVLEDLSPFSSEDLNPDRIRTSFENLSHKLHVVHIQIKDNDIYWQTNGWSDNISTWRIRKVCRMFSDLAKKQDLPDASFLITMHDGLTTSPQALQAPEYLPILAFAKTKEATNAILFPDPLTAEFARKRLTLWNSYTVEKLKPKNRWSQKVEKAFWRGSTTGGEYLLDNWQEKPRVKLALLSQHHPQDIDAGITQFYQMDDTVKSEISKVIPQADWVGHKKHFQYKYLVIADGNTCTYPRFLLGLSSGSLVFKDNSEHYQWFYRALEPGEHYVEVKADFSDLPEKVQWAKNHDLEAKKIAVNSKKWVRHHLKMKHIQNYMLTLLKEYSALQKSDITLCEGMQKFDPKAQSKQGKS